MKITKYFLSMAAAIGMIAGCQKPEMVQIAAPEDVIAPVLETFEGPIEITPSNLGLEDITLTWSLADYGVPTQINYSVEVATAANPAVKAIITSGITADEKEMEAGKISEKITYETLNAVLFNDLQLADGVAEEVLFTIGSKVGEYAKTYSNAVAVSCKVTKAEKQYPKVWVVGDYCGWNHDNSQFLFDFTGEDVVYQAVVDFGEKAANGWKITGVGKWDDTCNWGGDENETYEAEAAATQLVNGGGSKDLKHYSKRFYHFSLDKETLLLTKTLGFDNIGVVGSFNGWSETNNVEMQFNAAKQKFYADVEFTEDGEFKFNVDKAWTVSFGVGEEGFLTTENGGNIAVAAGTYRIYLMMNNYKEITYELNAKMYGKDEPVNGSTPTPEDPEKPEDPTPVTGWSLIGAFNDWAGDLMLASDGTYYVIKGAELEGELKFRKDGMWNYTDEDGNVVQTNLGAAEGVTFAADTELALAPNGGNLNVVAGTYDVYLDAENAKAWFITDGSYPGGGDAPEASEWGVVGDVNGWAAPDITMYKTATEGLFVAYSVDMPTGGFKIRANNEWNDEKNYGLLASGSVEVDHAYEVITSGGSGNLNITAGTYDIWFDLNNTMVYIMTPGKDISEAEGGKVETPDPTELTWYLVGDFNSWTTGDTSYQMTKENDWYVFKGFAADGNGFKFNAGDWSNNRGATGEVEPFEVTVNAAVEVVAGGKNLTVAAGTYDVYMNIETTQVYIMAEGLTPGQTPSDPEPEPVASEWGIVGDVNGWNAPDITMYTTATDGLFVAKNVEMPAGGFKIRANNEWNDAKNYGLPSAGTVEVDHAYTVITSGGSGNMTLAAGTYDIWFDLNNTMVYIMTPGKDISEAEGGVAGNPDAGSLTWYLVGEFNGWSTGDASYQMTKENEWYVFKGFVSDGKGFKLNAGDWSNNRGATGNTEPYAVTVNSGLEVVANGKNLSVTAGTYDVYMNAEANKLYVMTPGTTPGN